MANTVSNNRISNLINSQVPFFVRNDHQQFVTFLEKYYEFLEQQDYANENSYGVINNIKNILNFQNVDLTEEKFLRIFVDEFMKYIPPDILADKRLLIKHIKDFYRAKGTEKSVRFLLNIMFGILPNDFYYPKKDILKASDGKWFIPKSLRITDIKINGIANTELSGLEKFDGVLITGNNSLATAIVERAQITQEAGTTVREIFLSNINGEFENGEKIEGVFADAEATSNVSANIYGGIVNTITITNRGSRYKVGDPVIIESNVGVDAIATVSRVSKGNISSITVVNGGAGFQVNNSVLIFGDGTGAEANVSNVNVDNSVHPNSYNIVGATIDLETLTVIGNAVYSNLVPSVSDPANNWIANSMLYWQYANTGPISEVIVLNTGQNYSTSPILDVLSNTTIVGMGILGKMEIVNGGSGYQSGDIIEFVNAPGNFGCGANANVKTVNGTGAITSVQFTELTGHIIGGRGYSQTALPTTNVRSGTGSNANIVVTAILGDGESLVTANSTVGAIEEIQIIARGVGYTRPPTINLKTTGDGTANANATVIAGLFSYPGYFLNDDGMVSAYNFLEDRDFYQNFSYVIRSGIATDNYRDAILNLTHPAGMKLFGEYDFVDHVYYLGSNTTIQDSNNEILLTKYYKKTGNTINVVYPSHGLNLNDTVGLEFTSGNIANVIVVSGGSRYANAGPYTSSSNTGSGLAGYYFTDQYGTIKSANITNYGSGYSESSNIVILPSTANAVSNLTMKSFVLSSQSAFNIASNTFSNTVTMNLNAWVANSNVYFTTGDTLRLYFPTGGSNDVIVTDFSSQYANTPNLTANVNLVVNTSNLYISTGVILLNTSNMTINTGSGGIVNTATLSAWSANSNVFITIGDNIEVNGKVSTITFAQPISRTIKVYPGFDGNLISNVVSVYKSYTVTDDLTGVSNVAIEINDSLNVDSNIVKVMNIDPASNVIVTSPLLPNNIISNAFSVIKSWGYINLVNKVLTFAESNLTFSTETGPSISVLQLSGAAGTSDTPFSAGYKLNVNGQNVIVTSYESSCSIITITPSIAVNTTVGITSNILNVYAISYSAKTLETSNVYFGNNYTLVVNNESTLVVNSAPDSSTLNVYPALSRNYDSRDIRVIKYANLVNVTATTNTITGLPTYNLNNSIVSTVNNFAVLWQGPATFTVSLDTDTDFKYIKNGLYKVVDVTNPNSFNVYLNPVIDSITITNTGAGYNTDNSIIFTGGGGANANAVYTVNSRGNITSVLINDLGSGYTSAPTANANGSNSSIATFTVKLKYTTDTSGNVLVYKNST